jgi:hypothetical protein
MYTKLPVYESTILQKQEFYKLPMLQNYFSNSSCCFLLLFYPPFSQLPETAGCLKSQYHSEHFTVLRCSVIMLYNSLTGNTTHHILQLQWKTKLKQIWSTATATSQNSVLLTFSGQDVVYYKNFWFCTLLHTLLFPTIQTGIFPSALLAIPYCPMGKKQICPHAESKIRILWTSIFRLLVS